MAKNLLVINVDLRETRVALIEDGIIAELHVEDLIRPDDFEAYLSGGKRPDEEEEQPADGGAAEALPVAA